MITALIALCVVLAVCCVLLALRRRGRLETFFGRELDHRMLVRDHAVLGAAVLVVAVVHAAGMFEYAEPVQLASGALALMLLVVEVVLGVLMCARPHLRGGTIVRAHQLVAMALAVLVVVHVAAALW